MALRGGALLAPLFSLVILPPAFGGTGRCHQSLLQTSANPSKTRSSFNDSAKPATIGTRRSGSISLFDPVQPLKFYLPAGESACGGFFQTRIDPGQGILKDFSGWLWLLTEEHVDEYILHRLACSSTLVNSVEEADLCYPSCTATSSLVSQMLQRHAEYVSHRTQPNRTSPSVNRNHLEWMPTGCFEVPPHRKDDWWSCPSVCIQPEAEDACAVEVPYLHGIVWPSPEDPWDYQSAPWDYNFERTKTLAFVGCDQRGHLTASQRSEALDGFRAQASVYNAESPETVFSPYIINEPEGVHANDWYAYGRTPEFYLTAWEQYASAHFSWQPHGDTPTRRAVYDSVMFGCIPVICSAAAEIFRHLFNGALWKEAAIEDVFVIIPEGQENDGKAILDLVMSIPPDAVASRRSRLQRVARALQWGRHTPGDNDALLTALQSFRRRVW